MKRYALIGIGFILGIAISFVGGAVLLEELGINDLILNNRYCWPNLDTPEK